MSRRRRNRRGANKPAPQPAASVSGPPATSSNVPTNQSGAAARPSRYKFCPYIKTVSNVWLDMKLTDIEEYADLNSISAEPHFTDQGIFYDVLGIRKAVKEANDLALRADDLKTGDSQHQGLSRRNATLSNGRKLHMRQLAISKLSHAYRLNETITSAAMTRASASLDQVADKLKKGERTNIDSNYVYFHNCKLPISPLLDPIAIGILDEIVAQTPGDAAVLRSRGVAKMRMMDLDGAIQDLSEALNICKSQKGHEAADEKRIRRFKIPNHEKGRRFLNGTASQAPPSWEVKIHRPSSLQGQLLFHRGGTFLHMATRNLEEALAKLPAETEQADNAPQSGDQQKSTSRILQARKEVKANARRALTDFMEFLGLLKYSPGLSKDATDGFFQKVDSVVKDLENSSDSHGRIVSTEDAHGKTSKFVTRTEFLKTRLAGTFPIPPLYSSSILFSPSSPTELPSHRDRHITLQYNKELNRLSEVDSYTNKMVMDVLNDGSESMTFHPFLADALHSLLLCHALLQTPRQTMYDLAYNVARCLRAAEGDPIFGQAKSLVAANWIEVLERTHNWIGLEVDAETDDLGEAWRSLCKARTPPSLPTAETEQESTGEEGEEEEGEDEEDEETDADDSGEEGEGEDDEDRDEEEEEEEEAEEEEDVEEGPQPIILQGAILISRWILEAPRHEPGEKKRKRRPKKRGDGGEKGAPSEEMAKLSVAEKDDADSLW